MTEEELLMKIGQRIKELRIKKGLSQIELAAELNYEKSNMSRLESGRVNPKIATLHNVAKAFGIKLHELLDIESNSVQ